MPRDYGKVHATFWSSPTVEGVTDDGKMLALYLLTCSHSTIAGVYRLPDGYVAEDLGWDNERVSKAFLELFRKGFANRCETTKWVWVVKHLEWNKPENPNQCKAAAKVALSVPDQTSWKPEFARACWGLLGIDPVLIEAAASNPSGTVTQRFRNQEQEQEQKQEQEQEQERSQDANASLSAASQPTAPPAVVEPSSPGATAAPPAPTVPPPPATEPPSIPPCPVKQLVALFALKVPTLPKPRVELFAEGQGATDMRQRWKWVLTASREDGTRYATSAAEALTWFGLFFETVAASDFLCGRGPGSWAKCNLPWLMKRENFSKVVEGNYDNRPGRGS